MKRLAILGSTGSIGINTLDIVARFRDKFEVLALSAGANVRLLLEQIKKFRPQLVSVLTQELAEVLQKDVRGEKVKIVYGEDGLVLAATFPGVEMVVSAVVGSVGLLPLLAAIDKGKHIALANKESMVMAGEIIVKKAQERGVPILPIDSEHSAVFQVLGDKRGGDEVARIILTASGGPFYSLPAEELKGVSPEEALSHPVWEMGPKISVDSATLMNKGLEVIEAHWFFLVPSEKIDVLIHPQGMVHSLVEYVDSSVIAQLSTPDMRIPIAYALSYPKRLKVELPPLNLVEIANLSFSPPDYEKFPALRLAYQALEKGGTLPAVLNAANEMAVEAFLQKRIRFDQIAQVVAEAMNGHRISPLQEVDDALRADRWARAKALDVIEEVSK